MDIENINDYNYLNFCVQQKRVLSKLNNFKMNFKYLFIALFIVLVSCQTSEPTEPVIRKKIIKPRVYRSKIYDSQPLDSITVTTNFKVFFDAKKEFKIKEEIKEGTFNRRELQFKDARVFIYKWNNAFNDTLEIYVDSVRFNSIRLDKIASRDFKLDGRIISVGKYSYSSLNGYHQNLFVIPSSGLLLIKTVS